jgi:serine/threonine-protein kinase
VAGRAAPVAAARTSRPPPSGAFGHGRFSPGTPLGDRYRIVGLLGRGGMGEVYRADDLHLGQPVALKFLPADVERDPTRLEKFVTEIRTARQISHPNLCRVYDIGRLRPEEAGGATASQGDVGVHFLSMEYIDGEDLRSLLRRIGRLPEDKGLQIARQLCAGLAAMHDRGVLHRDLKPANVMIDGEGRVRLTDFGLAAAATDATGGEIAGTPAYMAPEQLAGGALTPQSDVYALGLVLFELFTGERVHKGDRLADVRQQQTTPATPLSKTSGPPLDPAIGRVIERCLDPDPKKRPASALEVAAALPGGDPLAAALAAGETPSPQLVAAAGGEGTLPSKLGVPLLVAFLVMAVFATWFNGRKLYTGTVPFPYPAEVLANKAREMLGRFGYVDTPADSGYGFLADSAQTGYAAWLARNDKSRSRWDGLASVRPPMARFWYRTSLKRMTPVTFLNESPGAVLQQEDPPSTVPGMVNISTDFSGRLNYLEVILQTRDETAAAAVPAPDWSRLFTEAGLDLNAFRSVPAVYRKQGGADTRAAWVGPFADAKGTELRVEAAFHRGRPVYFEQFGPWNEPADAATVSATSQAADIALTTLFFGILGLATFLAVRNVRSGRADDKGAMRLATVLGIITAISGMLQSPLKLSSEFDNAAMFFVVMSWAAFTGLLTWTMYVALEPYARRRWPQMLVSWSRLLDGRWRDPLIGRDLLIGSAAGVALRLLEILSSHLVEAPMPPFFGSQSWMGLGQVLAALPHTLSRVVWPAFSTVLMLIGIRIVVRREWLAVLGLVAIWVGIATLALESAVQIAVGGIVVAAMVIVGTRLGLVALLVYFFVSRLFIEGASLTPPAPLVGPTVVMLIALVAPALFGFWTSRQRRVATTGSWLE